jgi:hypothetical protein
MPTGTSIPIQVFPTPLHVSIGEAARRTDCTAYSARLVRPAISVRGAGAKRVIQYAAKSLLATTPELGHPGYGSADHGLGSLTTTVVPGVKALYQMGQTCRLDKSCRIETASHAQAFFLRGAEPLALHRRCVFGQSVPAVLPTSCLISAVTPVTSCAKRCFCPSTSVQQPETAALELP